MPNSFVPEISVADSAIHVGRKVWLWHLPGDVIERYGLIGDVTLGRSLENYIRKLASTFGIRVPAEQVKIPTDAMLDDMVKTTREAMVGDLANALLSITPDNCPCGRPKKHIGMCSYRHAKAVSSRLAKNAIVDAPAAQQSATLPIPQTLPPDAPAAIASWESMLLAKFPAFDPAWSDNVKIEWFAAFGSLMRIKP